METKPVIGCGIPTSERWICRVILSTVYRMAIGNTGTRVIRFTWKAKAILKKVCGTANGNSFTRTAQNGGKEPTRTILRRVTGLPGTRMEKCSTKAILYKAGKMVTGSNFTI